MISTTEMFKIKLMSGFISSYTLTQHTTRTSLFTRLRQGGENGSFDIHNKCNYRID